MASPSTNIRLRHLSVETSGETSDSNHENFEQEDNRESDYKAWLCVLGAIAFTMPSYGFMQSIGTVQSYIYENQLSNYSAGNVGWITGLYLFLSYFFNIQIGPLCDIFSPIAIGFAGIAICIASFLLLAECNTYWQFVLCLSVLGAIGGATIATIALSVIAKVFTRRRGFAMGVALTGSAIGSIVFPLILRAALPDLGWQWSMRIMALAIGIVTILGLCCFLPYHGFVIVLQRHDGRGFIGTLPSLSTFRSAPFVILCIGIFMLEFATFSISGLLPTIATRSGFGATDGYLLIPVMGACSFIGRVVPGFLSDMMGPFNVLIMMIISNLVFMAALFIPFTHISRPVLYAFAATWGLGSGSFLSIPPVCIGKTCESEEYGRYFGASTFIVSFSVLLSIPLGGIMLDSLGVQALAGLLGAVMFTGGICVGIARGKIAGNLFSIKLKV
ncbi:major facilitator superfamily domain-containing protein [Aspergillus bertholletiae]|uniref:Major facilitator superfamily domain-containing protein n=1 Tax=Aspergillus bertholletiae TaxID=1226010 RepID=A0A5N7BNR3_9EURO|nr:major facilitator superfamily domain-containing protein [Aspergillus bertholletiae]